MSTSDRPAAPAEPRAEVRFDRRVVLGIVLLANLLLTLALPGLTRRPVGADATERPFRVLSGGQVQFDVRSILRNETTTAQLFDAVRAKQAILYFGTSESGIVANLGAQLNAVATEGPRLVVLAMMGMSPIHAALLYTRTEALHVETPPLIILINPVYLTRSHDGINEGWMGSVVRSPVFLMLNHDGLLDALPPDVGSLYRDHFARRQAIRPLYTQQYAGNLLFLKAHAATGNPFDAHPPPMPAVAWDGQMPDYDEKREVHRGYVPSDALAQDRWEVQTPEESLNLKGLDAIAGVLQRQKAPALLLVLPVNRAFYAAYGRDMQRFDARYRDLRAAIAAHARPGHLFVIDLFDKPGLKHGFEDRMHEDAYGFHQLATYLAGAPDYREFLDAVEAYYAPDSR